jgi:hypothetical protein
MVRAYWVTRTALEWLQVEAEDEDRAIITAEETPIEEWVREIKNETVDEVLP